MPAAAAVPQAIDIAHRTLLQEWSAQPPPQLLLLSRANSGALAQGPRQAPGERLAQPSALQLAHGGPAAVLQVLQPPAAQPPIGLGLHTSPSLEDLLAAGLE